MIEGFIAVIVLIGVLAHLGGRVEKTEARAPDDAPSAIVATDDDGEAGFPCDDKGRHHRDLTVPTTSRSTSAPKNPRACDD